MLTLSQAVVVEGRYDKIKLDAVVKGIVVTTDGFNLFKDKEKQALLKKLALSCGLIVLTDSDEAGFQIRKFVSDLAQGGTVFHAYIPDRVGKEKRKQKGGRAGLLGVEGIDCETVEQAIRQCLAANQIAQAGVALRAREVTASDLFADGFSGQPGAADRRAALLKMADLPTRLSTNAMLDLLNRLHGYDGYCALVAQLDAQEGAEI